MVKADSKDVWDHFTRRKEGNGQIPYQPLGSQGGGGGCDTGVQ